MRMMRARRIGRLGLAMTLGRALWGARQNWQAVSPDRRERLQALMRQSGGRPSNLSPAERQELSALVKELRLGEVARGAAMSAAFPRRGFRRF